jgi:hypothetical protein
MRHTARARLARAVDTLALVRYHERNTGEPEMPTMSTDAADLARALAARRPRSKYTCEVCGAEFEAYTRRGKAIPRTCSGAHRSKLSRQSRATTKADTEPTAE